MHCDYYCMDLNLWQEKFHICILNDQRYLYIFIDTFHNGKAVDDSANDACYFGTVCVYRKTVHGRCT